MITVEERQELWPICPYCKKEIERLWFRKLPKDMGKRCLYFCPNCRSCLGISHRKGLTMGF
jgi:hypothetical protein